MKNQEKRKAVFNEYDIDYGSKAAEAIEEEACADGGHAGEEEVLKYIRKYCELITDCHLI